jgi:hypothetical protein
MNNNNNNNNQDPVWADGFNFKNPHPNAPDFVIGNISCKVEDAIAFLQKNKSKTGWVNIQVKNSKGGNPYMILDEWEPTQGGQNNNVEQSAPTTAVEAEGEVLPF